MATTSPLPQLSAQAQVSSRCAKLAHDFLKEMAAAEDAYARAATKASGALVSGLLATPFEGASTQRQCLVELSKLAAALSSESAAHSKALLDQPCLRLQQVAADHGRRAKALATLQGAHSRDVGAAEAAVTGARSEYKSVCVAAESAGAAAVPAADPWLKEMQLGACSQELEDVSATARTQVQESWDEAERSEQQTAALVREVLLDAARGMQSKQNNTAAAVATAVGAADGINPSADWSAFCVATRLRSPALSTPGAAEVKFVPNMAQVEKRGRLQRKVVGLLGSSWAEQQLVLTRGGWLHAFVTLEQPTPLLSVHLRGAVVRCGLSPPNEQGAPGEVGEIEVTTAAPDRSAAGGGGGGWRLRASSGGTRLQLRGGNAAELQAWVEALRRHTTHTPSPSPLHDQEEEVEEPTASSSSAAAAVAAASAAAVTGNGHDEAASGGGGGGDAEGHGGMLSSLVFASPSAVADEEVEMNRQEPAADATAGASARPLDSFGREADVPAEGSS